jgi:hypothetical protein|tara:strand:+ start:99 stop:590 length:492 start_codon:yes stop_codon:yes gene_type:complete
MGHMGHYSIGEQILGSYEVGKHGDAGASQRSDTNADLPGYAHGFYSLSHFESFSEVVYSKVEIGYDKGAREMDEVVRGAPLELYTPRESMPDPGSSSPSLRAGRIEPEEIVVKHPPTEIVNEILRAQQQVLMDIEEVEVEEIIIKRKFKKRRVVIDSESKRIQ